MANILVVDDEMGIRELLSEILYDEGHVVTLAENAEQARQVRQRMRPDLVLLTSGCLTPTASPFAQRMGAQRSTDHAGRHDERSCQH